jgi:type II secretory pathway component PulJ
VSGKAHGRHDDRGVSVVEMTVAAVLGALILAASATAFIGSMRAVRSVTITTTSLADARVAMEAVTRTLRVTYKPATATSAVLLAQPNHVQFWALLNRTGSPSLVEPPATLVEYWYAGGCLMEQQTLGVTTRTKCLVRTTVAPTFTYYTSGADVVGGVPVTAMPAPVAAASLPDIRSVQVSLTVLPTGAAAGDALPVISRVTFENLAAAGG